MTGKANATTDHLGNSRNMSFGVEDVVSNKIENPWLIETAPLRVVKDDFLMVSSTHKLSEIRDNIRNIGQLDAFATLAMYALESHKEDQECRLYLASKKLCYDIFIPSRMGWKHQFRKLSGRMYYRRIRTKKGSFESKNGERYE